MSINQTQQQAELHYIDSMFDVLTENGAMSQNSTSSPEKNNVKIDNSMYQLVSISAMRFAVPLSEITHVVDRVDVDIDNGLLEYKTQAFSVVDITRLIKPATLITESDYYLLIADRQIALACDQLMTMQAIDENTVCWRTEDSKRKWLAGTIKKDAIAILDVSILQQMQFSD